MINSYDVVIVGAGFTGLSAAHLLSRKGLKVCVVESDTSVGGLAGTFKFSDEIWIEKFYHHWFNSDKYVSMLAKELGLEGEIITSPTRTGLYYNKQIWKLSSPLDLLAFKPLPFWDRIRLGLLMFKVRRILDWRPIENLTVREWLEPLCGQNVYKVVWEPLIKSKFSIYAEEISAVWMWKKLILRGNTRNFKGGEELAYFNGGFGKFTNAIVADIHRAGGRVVLGERVVSVNLFGDMVNSLVTTQRIISGKQFLFTPAFPIIADIFSDVGNEDWLKSLRRIRYLGNICLVLRLNKSLSDTYWLNVNDPSFPFVGVIEHTNFNIPDCNPSTHIVYLSRYLSTDDDVWGYSDEDYLTLSFEHLLRMFPEVDKSWLVDYKLWRSDFAQPVAELNYSSFLPGNNTPYKNAFVSTMAQIYPEDRGTNYAIRDGKAIASYMLNKFPR
jgi:protoporphyrinogen oxidase